MWQLLQKIYTDMTSAGFPVESIIVAILTVSTVVCTWRIIKYMMNSKKEILDGQQSIDNTLTKVNSSLDRVCTSNISIDFTLQQLNSTLVELKGKSNNIRVGQALTLAELVVEESFSSMLRVYFDTKEWIDSKEIRPTHDSQLNERVIDRVKTSFDAISGDYGDKLSNFEVNNTKLSTYINDEFHVEWDHICCEITNRLVLGENSVKEYLKDKQEIFRSDLYKFIKEI